MPRIDIAERAGVGLDGLPRPTEDRVVITADTVVVLDGATEQREGLPSGGWYSRRLAEQLETRLRTDSDTDLTTLLSASIRAVAEEQDLVPRHSPSSTVAMVRWGSEHVEALVLADSPVVAFTAHAPDVLLDDRLDRLAAEREVRAELEDFNARVMRARYTPVDGPPLITQPRDVEVETTRWRERRRARGVLGRDRDEIDARDRGGHGEDGTRLGSVPA